MAVDILKAQVRKARQRLGWQRFLSALPWCACVALVAAATLVAIDKFYPLGVEPWIWCAVALGLSLAGAATWAWTARGTEMEAAVEIDHRFGLKERISSSLALGESAGASPAGQALLHDAIKQAERLDVAEQFRVAPSRWSWTPLVPGLAAFALAWLWHPDTSVSTANSTAQVDAQKKQIKSASETLRKKLVQSREEAKEQGLKDAAELFEKLEQGTKQLTKGDEADRKQALMKLNDLAKELEKRRQEMAGMGKLQEQLQQLKQLQKGPADKMADAMRQGDFDKALQELSKLKDELQKGQLDAQAKEQLAKQMQEMEQKLKQLAEAQQKMQEQLKQQIAEKRAAGQADEANELEKQLQKLAQNGPQMDAMKKMAEQLGQCAKCMGEGKDAEAAAQLEGMQKEMQDLAQKMAEAQMMADAMDEIAQCKDGMCQNPGQAGGKNQKQGQGDGLGAGRGKGLRPEDKTDTGFYDTKVRQKVGKGSATVTDLVEGPNAKGRVEAAIKTQWDEVKGQPTDPLSGQQLPRGYREHAKKYFDALREGEKVP